jgi:hypothetical protein
LTAGSVVHASDPSMSPDTSGGSGGASGAGGSSTIVDRCATQESVEKPTANKVASALLHLGNYVFHTMIVVFLFVV